VTTLAALLAAIGAVLWRARPARARDRIGAVRRTPARTATALAANGRRGWKGRRPRAGADGDDAIAFALAVELAAACVEAGLPLPTALTAASSVAGPATASALTSAASALRRGGEDQAWAACAADPRLAPVVRICRRVGTTGAAVADDLRRLATEVRRTHQADRRRRAQRAAVWVVLPLGLCFLPAFLLLTVLPVVAALLPGLR
jgi:hypothetical protein